MGRTRARGEGGMRERRGGGGRGGEVALEMVFVVLLSILDTTGSDLEP